MFNYSIIKSGGYSSIRNFLIGYLIVCPLFLSTYINGQTISSKAPKESKKKISFVHSFKSLEVEQGAIQIFSDYISTSDDIPTSAKIKAFDKSGKTPTWVSVNGKTLNELSYTTGSEISFNFDATTLSVGTHVANINASAPGYQDTTLKVLLTVKSASEGSLSNFKVNFQDSTTTPPIGWLRDFGQSFGNRTSPFQDSGFIYGWVKKSDKTPVNLTKNGRKRSLPSDVTLATLMHMQGNQLTSFNGTPVEGIWEAQVKNGIYDVTVSVGDGSEINSKHCLNVEGVNAITNFIPTTTNKFKSSTITISVNDGILTIDANGGTNTKINYVIIQPSTTSRPSVISVNPENNSVNVSEHASISTNILKLPNGGINNSTITSANVYLLEESTGFIAPSKVNGTGGGDAITLVPSIPLKLNSTYNFIITDGVKDLSGSSFVPFASKFTTGAGSTTQVLKAKFDKLTLLNAKGRYTSVTIGPDGKLYALGINGLIKRFLINNDGTLDSPELLYSLQDAYGQRKERLSIGLVFDPASTATNLIAWVTHSSYMFQNGPEWDGKLTKLSGKNLEVVKDVLINLPRSSKDHLSNSVTFGPDGALYFSQGSNSAMGSADLTWNNRNEQLLSAAILRLDVSKLSNIPLDVKTAEGGGTYNPYARNAPVTIYASGIRNAYDLIWHSNGNLYAPTNGSAAGGNTPSSVIGTLRPDSSFYTGPEISALTNIQQTQKDFLFRVVKGGYYGHPNSQRGEYVMNGGNPTSGVDSAQVNAYPVGTAPDRNWKGFSYNFLNNASPNGVIEYKSNVFNGALKGRLLIVRYSQHDDIITLTPGGKNNDIISAVEGVGIKGFSGFDDPLDLTEDVRTGNIYVAEYGGEGNIVLLRPDEADTLLPIADAYVRNGIYAANNYGSDTTLSVKAATSTGNSRASYLKFSLDSIKKFSSVILKVYGRNIESNTDVTLSNLALDNDSWSESTITWNNAPTSSNILGSSVINGTMKYYLFDVTAYIKAQLQGDKVASFLIKDLTKAVRNCVFNSKENKLNAPCLIIFDNTDSMVYNPSSLSNANYLNESPKAVSRGISSRYNNNTIAVNSPMLSMEEVSEPISFEKPRFFPNPLHRHFTIQFPQGYKGVYSLEMTDLHGKTYRIGKALLQKGGSNMQIDVTGLMLKPGTYFFKITSERGEREVTKLIIE